MSSLFSLNKFYKFIKISQWYFEDVTFVQNFWSFVLPQYKYNSGCEVTPEVNINKDKYNIKLTIPGPDMYEMEMGCSSPQQYVKWMAACRLASKGKTMADPTYEMEMSGVRTFLNMQNDVKDSSKDDGDYDAGAHVSFI